MVIGLSARSLWSEGLSLYPRPCDILSSMALTCGGDGPWVRNLRKIASVTLGACVLVTSSDALPLGEYRGWKPLPIISSDITWSTLSPALESAAFFPNPDPGGDHQRIMREAGDLLVGDERSEAKAFRGSLLHFLRSPSGQSDLESYQYFDDGILVIEKGKVVEIGPANGILSKLGPDISVTHYPHALIMPGFIDAHVHYPQTEMIASYGEQLLEWLNQYTFPTESKFQDKAYARWVAKLFLRQLLGNGTTSALVFSTVHKASVEALFEEGEKLNMRLITGKVLMDRHAPDYLLDTPESGYRETKELILQWRGRSRLSYAITPRFAPTSSEAQFDSIERLMNEFPDVHLQTHLSENKAEVKWVGSLFPWSKNYLDVYDHYHLLGPRSLFAHSIHLSNEEWRRLAESKSSVAFCPSSNLFLGSGLFKLTKSRRHGVEVGIGSDIGAGTSFSILRNLSEGYKVMQLQNEKLSPLEAFYLATLGGAKALQLESHIGNFARDMEADFIVIDMMGSALQSLRMQSAKTLAQKLFALMVLGDDRNILATYIMGKKAYAAGQEDLASAA